MLTRANRRADRPVKSLLVAAIVVLIVYFGISVATMLGWIPGSLGGAIAPTLPQPHRFLPAPDVIAAAPASAFG